MESQLTGMGKPHGSSEIRDDDDGETRLEVQGRNMANGAAADSYRNRTTRRSKALKATAQVCTVPTCCPSRELASLSSSTEDKLYVNGYTA
jgi:hypothetical protein